MTNYQAEQLRVGDRVRWTLDNPQDGTVTDIGYTAVQITWADGFVGLYPLDWDEWKQVERIN